MITRKALLPLKGSAGFTLVELLVVIAVLGLVLAGLFGLQQQGLHGYLAVSNRVAAQQDARVAIELVGREVRLACAIAASPAPTTTTLQFTLVDPAAGAGVDCSATGSLLTVQYTLSGSTLTRTVGGTPQPLIGGVTSWTLGYFDAAGVATTTAANIRSVDIALTTQGDNPITTSASGTFAISANDRVRLRNL